jgi:molybdopterin-guanine dinucleotide biosynthesis protein A
MGDAAIVILAGGAATRFPGKLEREIDGTPMLLRVYERLRGARPIYIAGKGGFPDALDARLDCTLILDRQPGRGPLTALVDACGAIGARRVFAVAADLPNVDAALLDELERAYRDGDEAVVPKHAGGIEPLAALYDRKAVLEHGSALLERNENAMRDLLAGLRVRHVPMEPARFVNVNTPADLERAIS